MTRGWQLAGCLLPVVVVAALVGAFAAPPLLAPSSDAAVPASCNEGHSQLPASRMIQVAGVGRVFLLLRHRGVSVALAADYGSRPFTAQVYVVTARGAVAQSMTFANDKVAAGASGGLLIIYNSSIAYQFLLPSGKAASEVVWVDKFRNSFTTANATFVNTNLAYSAIGNEGLAVDHRLPLAVVADGCWFPPVAPH